MEKLRKKRDLADNDLKDIDDEIQRSHEKIQDLNIELEKKNKEISDLTSDKVANAFGSGKRSYVMCPYTRVIDNDSGYETSRVEDVLDGWLDEFIISGLRK